MSFINLTDAEKLMRTQTPGGIRLKLSNMQDAPRVAAELNNQMPPGLLATDWSRQNRTWFAAVQVEKRMMGIILFLIVLVGAFGLVSSLVMTVNSKRSDIAILRTQGATRGSIMQHLYGSGRLHRNRRRADRCRRGASHCLQCGLHRRRDRTAVRRSVPAQRNLLYLGNAE